MTTSQPAAPGSRAGRLPGRRGVLRRAPRAGASPARRSGARATGAAGHLREERRDGRLGRRLVDRAGPRGADLVAGGRGGDLARARPGGRRLQHHPRREPRELLPPPAPEPGAVVDHGPDRRQLVRVADQAQRRPPHLHQHRGSGRGHRLDAVRPVRAGAAAPGPAPLPALLRLGALRPLRDQVAHDRRHRVPLGGFHREHAAPPAAGPRPGRLPDAGRRSSRPGPWSSPCCCTRPGRWRSPSASCRS